jgi:hypothetical protein
VPNPAASLRALAEPYRQARARLTDPKTLTLQDFMKRSPRLARLGIGDAFFVLAAHWPVFAGPGLGPHTYPVSLKKGELRVRASSSVLRQELTYAAPSILRIAKDHFGEGVVLSVKGVL